MLAEAHEPSCTDDHEGYGGVGSDDEVVLKYRAGRIGEELRDIEEAIWLDTVRV